MELDSDSESDDDLDLADPVPEPDFDPGPVLEAVCFCPDAEARSIAYVCASPAPNDAGPDVGADADDP